MTPKTVEETYQKMSPKEHILLRPDTYIGSIAPEPQQMYVWDEIQGRIVLKEITYVPGLYKIFDEILVNAADNKIRDPSMDTIRVDIDADNGTVSVFNNGQGIPVRMHATEQVYVPELIFGHLLTSSNYDDSERKVTGGRNGYGAKLCNIFSSEFVVETADSATKLHYRQRYLQNMAVRQEPTIAAHSGPAFTRITFRPDFARFGMAGFDADCLALLRKRVVDLAGILRNVKVFYNGQQVPISSFREYVGLYFAAQTPIVHEVVNARWEVAFAPSDDQFAQVSFVNGICTAKGGSHVAHVVEQIVEPLIALVRKRERGLLVKPAHVRNCLFVFVNALIENPAFDSQTKENLTLKSSAFGSRCTPSAAFIKRIAQTDVVTRIVALARAKQTQQLRRTDGAKTSRIAGIPKLDDANLAGTRQAAQCSLILTEGDSAKTLAVAGLTVVGRDHYGVFPLRGKLLNVREATHKQILENAEISAIKKILGLQHGRSYASTESLRYGHVIIMTDQDHDGSHIKGLVINMFDHFFPSLLKIPGFLQEFVTPIVRVTRRSEVIDFFTIPEYERWRSSLVNENPEDQSTTNSLNGWYVKYYKGLGTSDSKDAKNYFSNLQRHVKTFTPLVDADRELLDLAFSKKKADARKAWLGSLRPGTFLDHSAASISIADFVNRELILFSMADNVRSIPSVVDGMKPGQRKVLFGCFRRRLRQELKVAQLAGYIAEHSAYHHGEASLCATIVGLAQDFVGANNINLLEPRGQFGSRLLGGKDASSPRYIYTRLAPLARLLFREEDDPLLGYLAEDNQQIEPEFYVPIIPMVLVNGAEGIGTGWSTSIPNFDPLDLVKNIRRMMQGLEPLSITPYYRGFVGSIRRIGGDRVGTADTPNSNHGSTETSDQNNAADKFEVEGLYELNGDEMAITELPVGVWTQNYKEFLMTLQAQGLLKEILEYHTERTVYFLVRFASQPSNVKKKFKLTSTLALSNVTCFDASGRIRKYSVSEVQKEFYRIRLDFYGRRKQFHLRSLRAQLLRLENQVRFIRLVVDGSLVLLKKPVAALISELGDLGFAKADGSFDYLLNMPLRSLTAEKIERLDAETAAKRQEYEQLAAKSPEQLWAGDLDEFEREYRKMVESERRVYDEEVANRKGVKKPKKGRKKGIVSFVVPKVKKQKVPLSEESEDKPWERY